MARHHMTVNGPVPFTPEEEAEWDAREAALEADKPRQAAIEIREKRNRLLAESDWTQGKDISDVISGPWAIYRQALRDIPSQSGFPLNVQWPAQPE